MTKTMNHEKGRWDYLSPFFHSDLMQFMIPVLLVISGNSLAQDVHDRVKSSIIASERYFETQGTSTQGRDVIMVLSIMKEKKGVLKKFPRPSDFIASDPELEWSYFQVGRDYFMGKSRIEIPDSLVLRFLHGDYPSMDVLTVYSFYCHQYPLPKDYLRMLYAKAAMGEYDLTHAALQLHGCSDKGCLIENDSVMELKNLLCAGINELSRLPFRTSYATDLYAESLVMKGMLNNCGRISEQEIVRLISVQNTDGGWPSGVGGEPSRHHASMLGLWALLTYCDQHGLPYR